MYMAFFGKLLGGSYVGTELELELRETEILKLKGCMSQSIVLR